jgi:hypothetical protein
MSSQNDPFFTKQSLKKMHIQFVYLYGEGV